LLDRRGGHLNPLAYTRGLARAAAERGAHLHVRTPAQRLARTADGRWEVLTATSRRLVADTVVIATNAYPMDSRQKLRRSIVPMRVHGALTEPLPSETLTQILPQGQPLTDTRRLYSGVRKLGERLHLTLDGPLSGSSPASLASARARLSEFPWLPMPAITEQWHGWIALTSDLLPHVHDLAPGLLSGLGYCGRGIAAATVVGRDLARRVLGRPECEITFPLTRLRPLPNRTAAALAVAGTIAACRILDRLDMWRETRGHVSQRPRFLATSSTATRHSSP
jgi:glycine/D-amino acid oxidase-like deaminating enzyme